jgi:hypothetical protein
MERVMKKEHNDTMVKIRGWTADDDIAGKDP